MRFTSPIAALMSTALAALAGTALASPPLKIAPPGETAERPRVEVLASREDGLAIEFTMPEISVEEVVFNGQRFQRVTIPGGATIGEIGQPEIPTYSRLVAIPGSAGVQIETTVTSTEERTGYRLSPMQSDTEQEPVFAFDAAAYARNGFGSVPAASIGRPAILRDLRIVPLHFQPVRYNPATGTLSVARTVRVDVRFAGEDTENELVSPASRPISPSFDKIYRDLIVNYGETYEAGLGVAPGTWVVICPNDNTVVQKLQPLLDWHKRKGYPVRLATTAETGTTKEAIKSWLVNAYTTWPIPPEYVTIAGDADGSYAIPVWCENLSGYGGCGDHPYAQLNGGDVLADVHIGRLSFGTTTELDVEVAKCVNYESTPYIAQDERWFIRGAVAGDPGQSGYSVIQLQQWAKSRMREIGYTQVDTIFSGDFTGQMVTALNRGDTIFSYRGWLGMSGMQNSNISTLTNYSKLPFCVVITCDTGTFYSGTSRTEAFLRAGTTSNPRAGIGAIGTATTGTHTRYNNCMHYGILYGLLYGDLYTMGADLTRGKLEMYMNYQDGDPNHVIIWSYWNNLMGDPGVEIFTAIPSATTVNHAATLAIGANSVPVTVRDTQTLQPVADARVCLWKGNETYVVGYTDGQGYVELPVSLPTSGNLLITVTKHNRYPYLATIPVGAQSVYVGYQASTISDDNIGGSHGNGDGIINPGETIELRVQLKNTGSQSAPAVSATLTSDDPYVTITTSGQTFGDIAGGASAWSAGNYVYALSLEAPHGRAIRFGLDVHSGSNLWHSLIDQPVVSADLVAEGTSLYNVGANGILDPGESGQMSVKIRNRGGVAATSTTGVLTSLSPLITVTDPNGSFGDIAVGQTGENTADRFSISAASNTYQGYLATLRVVNQFSGGARDTTLVSLTVGTRSSDDPIGPDQHGYYAFDNTDVSYDECPTYNWIELDPSYGGSGTQVPLDDFGTYQDDSQVITLPFSFTYYGSSFTKATVCSNGWLAMGSTYLTEYRNWTIPAAGGPENMIAAFWDDLNLGGGGKVFSQYDLANHRYIIEWSRVNNEMGSQETFEIVLYDPAFYPTPSGDGAILFQYSAVSNTDSGDNYATVGIENDTHSDGLLYSFDNRYPAGAASLQSGRAIKFVPASALPTGTIQGRVTNASNGESPITGAEVILIETGRTFTTGEDGYYGGPVSTGTYTVVARHASFEPDTARNVVIIPGTPVTVDFSLTDILGPTIAGVTNDQMTNDTVGPYPIQATVTDYSSVAAVKVYYRVNQGSWFNVVMDPAGGDIYSGAIPGAPAGTRIDYYVWAQDSGGRTSTAPADAPTTFYTLLILDSVYSFQCEGGSDDGWQMGDSGDTATTGIWERADPVGTTYGTPPWEVQPEDDHTPSPGVECFVTGNGAVGGAAGDNDVDGGCTTLLSRDFPVAGAQVAFVSYWRWFAMGGNSADDEFAVDISGDGGANWIPFERVAENTNNWTKVVKDLSLFFTPLPDSIRLRFLACDLNSAGLIEAAIDDISVDAFIQNQAGVPADPLPARTGLTMTRPNPFQPSTTIQYALAAPSRVHLAVYDVTGRAVRTLVDGALPAGFHAAFWDGRDDRGASVPSGIYFCRFRASGARGEVQKLIRVE